MANFRGVRCCSDYSENTGIGEKMWVHGDDIEKGVVLWERAPCDANILQKSFSKGSIHSAIENN